MTTDRTALLTAALFEATGHDASAGAFIAEVAWRANVEGWRLWAALVLDPSAITEAERERIHSTLAAMAAHK